jgi:hypothetical protein
MASPLTPSIQDTWTGDDTSIAEIERELARLREESVREGAQPNLRTSVMTHIAWVPPEWRDAAENTLAGMAERHPSRTLLLLPRPDESDGLDAEVAIRCFPVGDRAICGEVIELTLRGNRVEAPASIVLPLLISDLPVFCRWRGEPSWGSVPLAEIVALTDRLVVDSSEWRDVAKAYPRLQELFGSVAVSDIAFSRTLPWRRRLADLWPEIRGIERLRIEGPRADAELVAGWLRSRLKRDVALTRRDAPEVRAMWVDGEPVESPGELLGGSDLLSAELDQYGRNAIYEAAVGAVVAQRK